VYRIDAPAANGQWVVADPRPRPATSVHPMRIASNETVVRPRIRAIRRCDAHHLRNSTSEPVAGRQNAQLVRIRTG
jgi:hypothetical protein